MLHFLHCSHVHNSSEALVQVLIAGLIIGVVLIGIKLKIVAKKNDK